MKKADKLVTSSELKIELKTLRSEMRTMHREIIDEIVHHFDVVAENIHRDVAGANQDEISLLQNKVLDHEERIAVLEKN